MIGNGFEFYFHWRKTFDAMTTKKKVQRSHFPTILPHFCTNFYGSKSLTFPCDSPGHSEQTLRAWGGAYQCVLSPRILQCLHSPVAQPTGLHEEEMSW